MKELKNEDLPTIEGEGIHIVDFWAPWCGPCKMLGPIFEELSEDESNSDVNFYKCNVDNELDIARKFNITNIPTIVFIKNGELIERAIGVQPKSVYQEFINAMK